SGLPAICAPAKSVRATHGLEHVAKNRRTCITDPRRRYASSLPWQFRIHCFAKRGADLWHSRGIILRSAEMVCTRWLNDWQSRSGGRLSAVHAFSGWQALGTQLVPTACYRQSVADRHRDEHNDSPDDRPARTI